MPRFPRDYIKTNFFHTIVQGINKSYIFDDDDDIKYYIEKMHNISKEHNINIISYCIMNNHAHLLIGTEDVKELSKFMQRLNTTYGIYYNKKYNRVGYVFKNRYKSEGIYNEKHLYNCIRYIYNNPVKAGICNKPEDYPYSYSKKIDKNIEGDYTFIDIEEYKCEDILKNFLMQNSIKLSELKDNRKKLKELIILLKEKYNISLRKISEEIGLNREMIRKIYKMK